MKKLWSNNVDEVKKEIERLINNKTNLVFVRKNSETKKLLAKGSAKTKNGDLLILYYPENISDFDTTCVCYYHLEGKPLRGFQCTPSKKAEEYLGVSFPAEIFEIQRRKHPRLKTTQNSVATFSLKNRQRVLQGEVKDVSLQGAKITGTFPTIILRNDILTPVTLNLYQRFKRQQESVIHLPEALVARSSGDEEMTYELGIHFDLPDDTNQTKMREYLDIRAIEDNI